MLCFTIRPARDRGVDYFLSSFRSSELSSPSEVFLSLASTERGTTMAFEAILNEVDELHSVSARLEGLAEDHPPVLTELLSIAGNVRNVATVLAVLVATKLKGSDGHVPLPLKPI
jgi:hypothetical protein